MNINNENIATKFAAKGKVKVTNGSIVTPEYAGLKLILNLINEAGTANDKVYQVFDKKWKKVKEEVKGWYASRINFKSGAISTVATQSDVWVINCLCKDKEDKLQPSALTDCLKKVAIMAKNEKASVHLSVLSLDSDKQVASLLESELVNQGISVTYYEESIGEKK